MLLHVTLVQREANQQSKGGIWSGFTGWQRGNDDGAGGSAAWEGNAAGRDPKAAGAAANTSNRDTGSMLGLSDSMLKGNVNVLCCVLITCTHVCHCERLAVLSPQDLENQALTETDTWREQQLQFEEQLASQTRAKQEAEAEAERCKHVLIWLKCFPERFLNCEVVPCLFWHILKFIGAALCRGGAAPHQINSTKQNQGSRRWNPKTQEPGGQRDYYTLLTIERFIVREKRFIAGSHFLHFGTLFFPSVDKQDNQQQPNWAGEPSPPVDWDTDPETDNVGGSGHRKELFGLPAGASGTAAEERSGRSEWRASHQHEWPWGSRLVYQFES